MDVLTDHPVESLARTVAETAHDGQVDKAGEPYIGHVERVVARLDDPLDRAVAWLHDVVEDTRRSHNSLMHELHSLPVGDAQRWVDVLACVRALTHRPNEPRDDYYARVRTSERAVRVKLADIADNSDPERLAKLPPEDKARLEGKYAKALRALGVPAPEGDDHQEGQP